MTDADGETQTPGRGRRSRVYNPAVRRQDPLFVHVERWRAPPPLEALARLAPADHPFLRLAAGPGFRGTPWSCLAADPVDVLRVGLWPEGQRLEDVLEPARPHPVRRTGPRIPFSGGWAGMIGYEARSGIEARPARRRPPAGFPSLWLGRYDGAVAWNHRTGESFVSGEGATIGEARARARALCTKLRTRARRRRRIATSRPRSRTSPAQHIRAVEAAQRAILRGDIFQTNLSHRIDAKIDGDARALFERLVEVQQAPYMTWLDLGHDRAVLSGSPERFVRIRGRVAETDPMKGTRPRGTSPREDRQLRAELRDSEKERAELAMIVDLSRNDLARVCEPGTVRVAVARRLLRFAHVHQAIGVVRGKLAQGLDRVDLLQAAFPPGSVTGAPKVRAMEIIDELEGEGRGPYCGTLGWLDSAGDMDLAVAIRTMFCSGGEITYRIGGGITLRSDPAAEWEETLAKGRALLTALGDVKALS